MMRIKLIGTREVSADEFGPGVAATVIASHGVGQGGRSDGMAMTLMEVCTYESLTAIEDVIDGDPAIVSYTTERV